MTILELLKRIGKLGTGLGDPTDDDLKSWLDSLNQAHLSIYAETKFYNPFLNKYIESVPVHDGLLSRLSNPWSNIDLVYLSIPPNLPLARKTYNDIAQADPTFSRALSQPQSWYISGGQIYCYPKYTGTLGVNYTQGYAPFTLTTSPENIPYPAEHQDALIYGAVYDLYIGETKRMASVDVQEIKALWLRGKTNLCNDLLKLAAYKYIPTNRKI